MGQYYDILIKRDGNKHFEHYDRSVNGKYMVAKLTEHSWWRNETLGAICRLIYKTPSLIYWVGDYSYSVDEINGLNHKEILKVFNKCYSKNALKEKTLNSEDLLYIDEKFIVNHTKKEYIDCSEYYKNSVDKDGWVIHPLSLMTAIGNGLGGGDYCGINKEHVGDWAGDSISIEDSVPEEYIKNTVYFIEEL